MQQLLTLSALEQAALVRKRETSSLELVEAHLEHIARINPTLHAATEILRDQSRAAAREADNTPPAGIFHGVPFSIKDSIELSGTICTAGTLGRKNAQPSTEDAVLVQRLRAAGAIPIAKTNLPDLLFAFESDNLIFGRTNNPYDLACTAGGSSGGEAALIAACGSPMGLGSDAAGSVRLPAAFCGIAGIKPTSGRLNRTGHIPPASGWIEMLWQIGPMARSVNDLVAMMTVLTEGESVPFAAAKPAELRVAFYSTPHPEIDRAIRRAARSLEQQGCAITESRPAALDAAYDLEMKLLGADGGDSIWQYLNDIGSNEVHPLLRAWLEKLEPYRTDLAGFQRDWAELDAYRAAMSSFIANYDAVLCPVYTQPALAHRTSTENENFRGFHHTMAFNVTGWPAAVVRCGTSSTGLPIAVQIAAKPFREDIALAIAQRLEDALGGWQPPPDVIN